MHRRRALIFSLLFQVILMIAICSPASAAPPTCQALFRLSPFVQRIHNLEQQNEQLLEKLASAKNKWERTVLAHQIHRNDVAMAQLWKKQNPQWPRPQTMAKHFIGERDWTTLGPQRIRVSYLNKEQREQLRIEMGPEGLRSAQTHEAFPRNLYFDFIISADGQIYSKWITPEGTNNLRHSSFTAGSPVLFAGFLEVRPDGTVLVISNHSGHYLFSNRRIQWAISFLEKKGFDFSEARIDEFGHNNRFTDFWDNLTGHELPLQ